MRTTRIAANTAMGLHEDTLKAGPGRLLTFLQAVAEPAIRVQFERLGWSDQRLEEAWSLLNDFKAASLVLSTPTSDPVGEAIAACEEWQAVGLVRARAMLQLSLPEQASFMFHDFEAAKGIGATLNVATFLSRWETLASGSERKSTRKADQEALVIMEDAGVTDETRQKLRALVATVQSVAAPKAKQRAEAEAKRLDVLRKIHAWLAAWSDMARTVVTRRDQLIRLGIAKRRSPRKVKTDVVVPPATPPITPPAPVVPQVAPFVRVPPVIVGDEQAPDSRAA